MTDDRKSPPKAKPRTAGADKGKKDAEGGVLSRWSARKVAVAQGEAEAANAEPAAKLEDAEQLEKEARQTANRQAAEAIDIETADYGTDFTPFLRDGVPPALRRRALKALWRTNPMLANVDGLNDYDEDFRAVSGAFEVVKSTWEIGRGHAGRAEEVTREMQARDEEIRLALAADAEIAAETSGDADGKPPAGGEEDGPANGAAGQGKDDRACAADSEGQAVIVSDAPSAPAAARLSLRHRLLRNDD